MLAMGREFDDALNDCLERIAAGEAIQDSAGRYPKYMRELVPLLEAAATTMKVAASASYPAAARERGRASLIRAAAERAAGRPRRQSWLWHPARRPIAIGLAVVLVATFAAGGTTWASSNSVPGDPLYWVKTTKENLSLKIPRSDEARAQAHAKLANVRGQELRRLAERGKFRESEKLVVRLRHHLNVSAMYAGIMLPVNRIEMPVRPTRLQATRSAMGLRTSLERDVDVLRAGLLELMRIAPLDHRNKVRVLMRRSDLGYRIVIQAMYTDDPHKRSLFWIIEPSKSPSR